MTTPQLSILLGSGFSIPEGLPRVSDINNKLANLKKDDFYLLSDQTAGFYKNDDKEPNAWFSYLDREFAEQFTSYYITEVLNGDFARFNYEVFYDYIYDFLRFKKDDARITKICQSYRDNLKDYTHFSDNYNLVWRFSKIFNQLVADLLFVPRYYEDVGYGNYPTYDPFFGLLRENLQSRIVNVHTLNHDLFFDHIASKHTNLWQHFSDGFTEYGSHYYGEVSFDFKSLNKVVHKTYKVRLKFYNGVYKNNLRLFKLHGSVNYIRLHLTKTKETVRIKKDFGVREFLFETFDTETQSYKYDDSFADNEPDYLTGTTEKIRQYNYPFYEDLFNYFKDNLKNSNHLIVIGYGFQDRAINEYIENNFLIFNKNLIIVDIKKPDTIFFEKYSDQITFVNKGVTEMTFTEWRNALK